MRPMSQFVVLHNIRSAHNVGSIFRTADGAGIVKLFLCGYTPTPVDRFGRPNEEIAKTSLGATESVPWEYCAETKLCLERLRREGVAIVAVEQHARALPYTEAVYGGDVAYIFGNEIEGVPNDICEEADSVVHIPMHGMKESLNVSVSAGIILFEARKKQ